MNSKIYEQFIIYQNAFRHHKVPLELINHRINILQPNYSNFEIKSSSFFYMQASIEDAIQLMSLHLHSQAIQPTQDIMQIQDQSPKLIFQHFSNISNKESKKIVKGYLQILTPYLKDQRIINQAKFQQLVMKSNCETVFNFLWNRNTFMQMIFELIMQNKKCMQLISSWAIANSLQLGKLITKNIRDIYFRLRMITITIHKKVFNILDKGEQPQFYSNQLLKIYLNKTFDYQDFLMILSSAPVVKRSSLMKKYYYFASTINLNQKIMAFLQQISIFYFKNQIWTESVFINHLNEFLSNSQLMTLKELKHNIIHQMIVMKEINSVKEFLQKALNQNQKNRSIILSLFNQHNINNITPVAHALQYWPYKFLQVLLWKLIDIEEIKLPNECLLNLLKNTKLKQKEVQSLMILILQKYKNKGFIKLLQRVTMKKNKLSLQKKYDVIEIYDIEQLKILTNKINGCAVINYINRYKQKSLLEVIQKLQPTKFHRKSMKNIYKIITKLKDQKQYGKTLNQVFYYYQEFKMTCLKLRQQSKMNCNNGSSELFSFLYSKTYKYQKFWPAYFQKYSIKYHLQTFNINAELEQQIIKYVKENLNKFHYFLFQQNFLPLNFPIVKMIQRRVKKQFLEKSNYLNNYNFYKCLKAIKSNNCIISRNQFNNYMLSTYKNNSKFKQVFPLRWGYDKKYPFDKNIFFQISSELFQEQKINLKAILSKHFKRVPNKYLINYQYADQITQSEYQIIIEIFIIMKTKKVQLKYAILLVNTEDKTKKYQQFIHQLIMQCPRILKEHKSQSIKDPSLKKYEKLQEVQLVLSEKLLSISSVTPYSKIIKFMQNFMLISNIFYQKSNQSKLITNQNTFILNYKHLKRVLIESMKSFKVDQIYSAEKQSQIQCLKNIVRKAHLFIQQRLTIQYKVQQIKMKLSKEEIQSSVQDIFFYLEDRLGLVTQNFDYYLFYLTLLNQIELEYFAKLGSRYYKLFYVIYLIRTNQKDQCMKYLRKFPKISQLQSLIEITSYELIVPLFNENKYIINCYYLNSYYYNPAKYLIKQLIKRYEDQQVITILLKMTQDYLPEIKSFFRRSQISKIINNKTNNFLSDDQKKKQNYLKVFSIILVNKHYYVTKPSKMFFTRQIQDSKQVTKQIYWKRFSANSINMVQSLVQNNEQFLLYLKIVKKIIKEEYFMQLAKTLNIKYYIYQHLFYFTSILVQEKQWLSIKLILQNPMTGRKTLITNLLFQIYETFNQYIQRNKNFLLSDQSYISLMCFILEKCQQFNQICEENIYLNFMFYILFLLYPNGIQKYIKYINYSKQYQMPDPNALLYIINYLPSYATYFQNLPSQIHAQMIKFYNQQQQKNKSSSDYKEQKLPQDLSAEIVYKYKNFQYNSSNRSIINHQILHIQDYVVAKLYIKIFTVTKRRESLYLLINILITQNWHIDLVKSLLTPLQFNEVVSKLIIQNPQKFDAKKWGINVPFQILKEKIQQNALCKYNKISLSFFKAMIQNNCFEKINKQQNKLKYQTLKRIFKTQQKDKIQLYMNKYSFKFDQKLRKKLQLFNVDITHGIQNHQERKIIQIINSYSLIQYFYGFDASQRLLLAICRQRMFQLLAFYIYQLKTLYDKDLQYVQSISSQCGLRANTLRLPLYVSENYKFFAYHYLMKSSKKQKLPLIQRRSQIFKKFDLSLYLTKNTQDIRQIIVSQAKTYYDDQQSTIPQFQFIISKKIVFFQQILSNSRLSIVVAYLVFKFLFEEELLSTNYKIDKKLINSLISTVNFTLNNEQFVSIGIFQLMLILYLNRKKHQIPEQILQQKYSKQMRIIAQLLFIVQFNCLKPRQIELRKQFFNNYRQLKEQLLIYNPTLFIQYFHEELCMSQAQFNQLEILLSLNPSSFKQISNDIYQTIDMKKIHAQVDYFIGICVNLRMLSQKYSQIYYSYCFKLTNLFEFYSSKQSINKYNIMINMILLLFIIKAEFEKANIPNDLYIEHLLYFYEDKFENINQVLYHFIDQINSPNTNIYRVNYLIERLLQIQKIKNIKRDLRYRYLSVKNYQIKLKNIKQVTDTCLKHLSVPEQILISNLDEAIFDIFSQKQLRLSSPLIQMVVSINIKIILNELIEISNYLISDANQITSQKLNITRISELKQIIKVSQLQFVLINKNTKHQHKELIELNHNIQIFLPYEIVGQTERFYFITFSKESIQQAKQMISKIFIESSMKKSQQFMKQKITIKQNIYNNLLWTHSYKFNLETLLICESSKVMNSILKGNVIGNKIIQMIQNQDQHYNEGELINQQSRFCQHFKNNFNYYGIQSLFGPFSQMHDPNQTEVEHFLSFYRLIQFPESQKTIQVKFIHEAQINFLKKIDLSVLSTYCKYVYCKYKDKQFQDKFQNTLYFTITSQKEVKIIMEHCSSKILINMIKILKNKQNFLISSQQIVYKFSINSIKLTLSQIIRENKCQQNFKDLMDQLINTNTINLLNQLILLNYNHIVFLNSIKYCVFNFILNQQNREILYVINENLSVTQIQYEKSNHFLLIHIYLNIGCHKKSQDINKSYLPVNRKDFLKKITTIYQITNEMIKKKDLEVYCHSLSKQISNKIQTSINTYINYEQLYDFAQQMFEKHSIQQFQTLFNYLFDYITLQFKSEIQYYQKTSYVQERYKNLIYCVFQSILIQRPLSSLLDKRELDLQSVLKNKILQVTPRIYFKQTKLLQQKKILKNTFLLQIKKHSIKEISKKAEFLCQFKDQVKKQYTLAKYSYLKIQKVEQYSKFAIHDIDYIFMIAKQIPQDSQFSHHNILSIFYSDSNEQIYRIYQQKKILSLINDEIFKNSVQLTRVLNMNICLYFQFDRKYERKINQQTFIINLRQLFQRRKIFIQNIKEKSICLLNKFIEQQKNIAKLKQLQQLYSKMFESKLSLKFFMQSDKDDQKIQRIILVSLDKLQYFFRSYLQRCQIDEDYKLLKSIQKSYCIITANIVEQKRKSFFTNNVSSIQIYINSSSQYKVEYKQQTKTLMISIGSDVQYFYFSLQFERKILQLLLNISHLADECIKYNYLEKQKSNVDILCAIDYNLLMEDQIKELQIATKLIKYSLKLQVTYLIEIVCNDKSNKSQFYFQAQSKRDNIPLQSMNKFFIRFNISSSLRIVFTANYLVNQLLGTYYQILLIQYDPEKRQIICDKIYYEQSNVNLYTFSQNKIISQKLKINQQALPRAIIPYGTKISEGTRFFIVFPQNKVCVSNYFFNINRNLQENIIIDKQRNKLYPNKIYKMLLRQKSINSIQYLNCKKIQNWWSRQYTVIQEMKNQANSDLNLFQVLKIKKISKNVNVIQLQSSKQLLMSLYISRNSLLNMGNPQINHIRIQFSGKKQMQTLDLNFVKFTIIKFDLKRVYIRDRKSDKVSKFNQLEKYLEKDDQLISYSEFARSHVKKQSFYYRIHHEDFIYTSRAGEKRVDIIQFINQQNIKLQINSSQKIKACFVHSHSMAQVQAKVLFNNNQIELQWMPTLRGSYLLFINNWCIKKNHQIGILANTIDLSRLEIVLPQLQVLNFDEDYQLKIKLRDSFNNQYTQLQSKLFYQQLKSLVMITANSRFSRNLVSKINNINQDGILSMSFRLSFTPQNEKVQYNVMYKGQKIKAFTLLYKESNLQYRKFKLQEEVSKLAIYQLDLTIQRNKFFQDIIRIAQNNKLLRKVKITFYNEHGVDAGGLKRQFYDLIGKQMKRQSNCFFKVFNHEKGTFFFHPKLLSKKNSEQFMIIWGKYLANSIINGYLTGINFAEPFVKLLYGQPISYEDLLEVSSKVQIQSYQSLFKYSNQDLQSICLNFTELKEDGATISVTMQNLQQYLNLKANYMIKIRYKQIISAFLSGFNQVFDIQVVKQYIKSSQFWCLTMGRKQITPQILIKSINFTGQKIDLILSWFKKYIYEAKPQILIGFLKFTTSSSCLQFNMGQTINVYFENSKETNPLLGSQHGAMLNESLPVSHTCFKKLEVPRYKSYQILKQKLDYAFRQCAQGFGIV